MMIFDYFIQFHLRSWHMNIHYDLFIQVYQLYHIVLKKKKKYIYIYNPFQYLDHLSFCRPKVAPLPWWVSLGQAGSAGRHWKTWLYETMTPYSRYKHNVYRWCSHYDPLCLYVLSYYLDSFVFCLQLMLLLSAGLEDKSLVPWYPQLAEVMVQP